MPDPGWFLDPEVDGQGRYWDGAAWSHRTVEIPPGKTLSAFPDAVVPIIEAVAVPSESPVPLDLDSGGESSSVRSLPTFAIIGIAVVLIAAGLAFWALSTSDSPKSKAAPAVDTARPTRVMLTAGGVGLSGQVEKFTVTGRWRVELSYGRGANAGEFGDCVAAVNVSSPAGAPTGLRPFQIKDDPPSSGTGSGAANYATGGTFIVALRIACGHSTPNGLLPWQLRVID